MAVTFGQWLRQRRKALGWSQEELAQWVGCSSVFIRKIEGNKRRPSHEVAVLIIQQMLSEGDDPEALLQLARVPLFSNVVSASEAHILSTAEVSTRQPLNPFTDREQAIWGLIRADLPVADIAERLSLKLSTVRWYVKQIYSKLGVHSRDEALLLGEQSLQAHAENAVFVAHPKHNLPAQTTEFVGREDELVEILRLLDMTRLTTIIGPGGMGKSRLAVEAAAKIVERFANGVYYISLAPLAAPEHIISALAETFGLSLFGNTSPKQQLLDYVCTRKMLLLLDNCEHLLPGIGLVSELLAAAPQLRVLATSRAKLDLQEETIFRLGGMDTPDEKMPQDALEYSAAKLFLQGAQRIQPNYNIQGDDLATLARICRQVQGMPLGLLLAAAWMDTLSLAEISTEIAHNLDFLESGQRNTPERQRSIRALFNHSWALLTELEREGLQRLSVFRGGFSREAAQEIASASLRTLAALVNKSLLRRNPDSGRYEIHELIRQFAEEQLDLAGEASMIQEAHACYYAAFMEQLATSLKGHDFPIALKKLNADWDNIRVACVWTIAARNFEQFDRLLESLFLYGIYLRIAEVQELWQQALRQFAPQLGEEPSPVWGKVLSRTAHILELCGPSPALASGLAHERVSQALEIARSHTNMAETGYSLLARGLLLRIQGRDNEVLACYMEALSYLQRSDDSYYLGDCYHFMGFVQSDLGQMEASFRSFQKQLDIARQIGNDMNVAWALLHIGNLELHFGRTSNAERAIVEAITINQTIGYIIGISNSTLWLANLTLLNGDYEQARVKIDTALKLAGDCGAQRERNGALILKSVVTCLEGYPDRARQIFNQTSPYATAGIGDYKNWLLGLINCEEKNFESAQTYITAQQQQGLMNHKPLLLMLSLPPKAISLAHHGSPTRAAELLGLAATCPAGWTGWMNKWSLLTRLCADLERELGTETYQSAWERGKTMVLDRVVAELLDDRQMTQVGQNQYKSQG